ncbi:unnamed protein product [Toxocara canis]|uniref:Pecanex-like protein n=1 Tax=Toxocara canis TaxID=6265 RepID=A0A183VGJ8_TOXCA|nr:unnamed protein product [Toxocara canis]
MEHPRLEPGSLASELLPHLPSLSDEPYVSRRITSVPPNASNATYDKDQGSSEKRKCSFHVNSLARGLRSRLDVSQMSESESRSLQEGAIDVVSNRTINDRLFAHNINSDKLLMIQSTRDASCYEGKATVF